MDFRTNNYISILCGFTTCLERISIMMKVNEPHSIATEAMAWYAADIKEAMRCIKLANGGKAALDPVTDNVGKTLSTLQGMYNYHKRHELFVENQQNYAEGFGQDLYLDTLEEAIRCVQLINYRPVLPSGG